MQIILLWPEQNQINKASTFINFLFSCSEFSESQFYKFYHLLSCCCKCSWFPVIRGFDISRLKILLKVVDKFFKVKGLKVTFCNKIRKELIFISQLFFKILLRNSQPPCIQIACQNSISGDLWGCKVVHTSRWNQWIN